MLFKILDLAEARSKLQIQRGGGGEDIKCIMYSCEFEAHTYMHVQAHAYKKVVSIRKNQSAFSIFKMSPPSSVTRIGKSNLLLVHIAKLLFVIFLETLVHGKGLGLA
jgi:hypothetical protein